VHIAAGGEKWKLPFADYLQKNKSGYSRPEMRFLL
jgi:hypothetical protein